jgi:hypothetical protein
MRIAPLRAFALSFVGSLVLLFGAYDAVAQLMRTPVETPRGPLPIPAQPA